MLDRDKVIKGLREMSCRATWKDIDRIRDRFQPIINDAIALLKETEKMLEKACKILNDIDSDFFCEALNNGDGWCEEHCVQNGYASNIECVKRYLKKQIEKDEER